MVERGTAIVNYLFLSVRGFNLLCFFFCVLIRKLEQDSTEINAVYFKNHVMQSLNILFGEVST
jgi:hypothetical protein